MTKVIYPGTFDPVTLGHLDIIKRVAPLFDEVVVAVAASAGKRPVFSLEERIGLLETVAHGLPNVSVIGFDGLMTDLLNEQQAHTMVRGIRSGHDMDYEAQLAQINRIQRPGTESLFLPASPEYAGISSSIVREIARLGGDVSRLVPPPVTKALQARFSSHTR